MNALQALRARYQVRTNPLRTERNIELVAVALLLLLLLLLIYTGLRAAIPPSPTPVEPAASSLTIADQLARRSVSSEDSEELRARPLFWEGRRPAAPKPVAPVAKKTSEPASKLKDVRLLGVFGDADAAGMIVLVNDKQSRVLMGQSLSGWELQEVASDHVVLVSGRNTEKLSLQRSITGKQARPRRETPAPQSRPGPQRDAPPKDRPQGDVRMGEDGGQNL
ncbi:type II secretion system protein N [Kineobactrum salinum]|uniref:Type II secretion system protein GspC N-terminal domain-containing protein n=1 Tax=Kineobactrum salinum TaxID=2708301 RepID=A0A6C0U2L0_9GAMM|nr:type II secretion system protein N [Kineobactrum salinum]QIB66321.1 hypothetical protein G3T16_13800 [Kineobactrum salinum]